MKSPQWPRPLRRLPAFWATTSWLALGYGLTRDHRLALGGVSRRLGLA